MNKILIIDDDVKLTELLDEFFSHHDFEIKCLHTPIKCLETIKQFVKDTFIDLCNHVSFSHKLFFLSCIITLRV